MSAVADRLNAWLTYQHTRYELPVEPLLAWANDAGDDLLAAWDTCPRAEYQAALAGAYGVPFLHLLPTLWNVGREIVKIIPDDEEDVHNLMAQAEAWEVPDGFRVPLPPSDEFESVCERLENSELLTNASNLSLARARREAGYGFQNLCDRWFAQLPSRLQRAPANRVADARHAWVDAFEAALRGFFETDPSVQAWREAITDVQRTEAEIHARRVIASVSLCVQSSDQAYALLAFTQEIPILDPETAERTFVLVQQSIQRVASEASQAFHHAALVAGFARSASEDSTRTAMEAALTPVLGMLRAEHPVDEGTGHEMDEMINATLDAIVESAADNTSRMLADAMRRSIDREVVEKNLQRDTHFWSPTGTALADKMGMRRTPT